MNKDALIALINNAALLLALGVLYEALPVCPRVTSRMRQIACGVIIGMLAIAVMLNPWILRPGIIFDTRSILLSLTGLFFGAVPAAVAAAIAAAYRFGLGGDAAGVGIGVIFTSAGLGLAWRHLRRQPPGQASSAALYVLGIVVHVSMLAWMLLLPWDTARHVLGMIAVPVMLVYPVGTVLLGRLLARQSERREAENVTTQRERRFRKMVEQGWDLITLANAAGQIQYASASMARILGYDADACLGMSWTRLVHADDAAAFSARLDGLLKTPGAVGTVEARVRHRDGRWRWIEMTLSNLLEDSDIGAVVVNGRDVTGRRTARLSLEESESRYRSLFENNKAVMLLIDPATGAVEDANHAACEFYGWTREELRRKFMPDINTLPPEQVAEKIRLAREEQQNRFTFEHRLADGSSRHVEVYSGPIQVMGKQLLYSIIHDITERVRAENQLRQTAQRLALSAEAAKIGIWELDPAARSASVDDRMYEIYGVRKEDVDDAYAVWESLVHPDDLAAARDVLWNAVEHGDEFHTQFRIRRPDGEIRHIEAHGRVLRAADGTPQSVTGIHMDITDRVLAEEERGRMAAELRAAQKMEAIGRLAGGVAHDFNNMLNVILGCAEIALSHTEPASALHGELTEIVKAGNRSAELTRQLLAFSRKQVADPHPIDLNRAVSDQQTMLSRLIGEHISVVFKPGNNLWRVRLDPSQLDQILANLAVNARDAILGSGTVAIETGNVTLNGAARRQHVETPPGDYVMLVFRDTGVGMDPETLEHIFEPFFTTKEKGKGTGLGLATVYGIVKQNGGFIHAQSRPGKGATFRIYLPRFRGDSAPVAAAPKTETRGGKETVLVVEDEIQILTLTQRALERLGYAVLAAPSPEAALDLIAAHSGNIDLLLTDVVMPRMNGKELQTRVLETHPKIKTLFMSGYTADIIAHHGVLDKGVAFLHKPFTLETLAAKVRGVLEG